MQKIKILVIFTGGTIGSSVENGVISPDRKNKFTLIESYLKGNDGVAFETLELYNILSENLDAEHLNRLYECVIENSDSDYNGIIVTHGTDTLQFTTAFLALTLGGLNLPVITVSANYPLSDSRTNGFANFFAAVDFIRSNGKSGVFAAYTNSGEKPKIHCGARLLPHRPFSDSLESLGGCYGEIISGEFVENRDCPENKYEPDKCEYNPLSSKRKVLFIRAYPNMVASEPGEEVKALLVEGYHSGTLPTGTDDLSELCKKARQSGLPVWLTGSVEGFNYESKMHFESLGIKLLPPMSPIAAYMYVWLKISNA